MKKEQSFIPAEFFYPLNWFIDFNYNLIAKLALNLEGVLISDKDRDWLRTFQNKRILYLSNHPSSVEPPVAYAVANAMGTRFNYMAARNVFNWGNGLVGELIRRVGAFSVLSGGADKDAMKTARGILASHAGKLVIYPEGMMTGENDNLVSFMPGISQIGFWGLEDARKKDASAEIYVLPAFVKYMLVGGRAELKNHIEESLFRVEKKLGIDPGKRNILRQFLTVGRVILELAEKEMAIVADPEKETWDFRVGRARHHYLNRAAIRFNAKLHDDLDSISKIRELFVIKDQIETGFKKLEDFGISKNDLELGKKDLDLAYTFLIVKPDYILSHPSPERLIEWIYRFETFVDGKSEPRRRTARMLFASAIPIGNYYEDYKKDKRKSVDNLTKLIRSSMDQLVIEGTNLTYTLYAPYSHEG